MYGILLYQQKYWKITVSAQGVHTLGMHGSMQPEHKTL